MGIKKIIKKTPLIGHIVAWLYNKTIKRIKSGYFYNKKFYNKNIKRIEISSLKKNGVTRIKKYHFDDWKFNSGIDHSFRRYYIGVFNGIRCFIKISNNDLTVFNEICISEDMPTYTFVPKTLFADKSFNGGFLLIQEQLFNLVPLQFRTAEEFNNICEQFDNILDCFSSISLVHCDIHKGNLMISKRDNRLFLLDFGISKFAQKNNLIDYIARPGTFYKRFEYKNQVLRKYDDAYSFIKEIERMNVPDSWKNCSNYQRICDKVGKNTIVIVEGALKDEQ